MKISKERLKQLIAEELTIGVGKVDSGGMEHDEESTSYDSDGHMAKQNLWKMAEYAKELYNLIEDDEDLEPWVEEKIAIASFMMDSVGHYMQYEKNAHNADVSMSKDDYDSEHGDDTEGCGDMEDSHVMDDSDDSYEFDPEDDDVE